MAGFKDAVDTRELLTAAGAQSAFGLQVNMILGLLQTWDEAQLRAGMEYVLDNMDTCRLGSLAKILQSRMQRDFISFLPNEMTHHIFNYLDFHSLISAGAVNRRWRAISSDPRLWQKHWQLRKWTASAGEQRQLQVGVPLRSVFLSRLRVDRNWLAGDYYVHTLHGHADSVTCLQFEDRQLVTGSDDSTIKVWDLGTGQCRITLQGHTHMVTCVKMHGNRLLSGSWDGTVKMWVVEGASYKCVHTFNDHTAGVLCLAYNNGRFCLSGSFDNTIRIYDVIEKRCRRTLRGHTGSVHAVQFDKRRIVSGSEDTTIKVWDVRELRCIQTLRGHTGPVTCLQFDESVIVSGSCDRTIRVWDLMTGEPIRLLQGHQGAVHCLQFGDGRIVSGAGNESVKIWDFASGKCLHTLEEHTAHVNYVAFDHHKILSGSGDATIKIINFAAPDCECGPIVSGVPAERKRRAKTLSGTFSIDITALVRPTQNMNIL